METFSSSADLWTVPPNERTVSVWIWSMNTKLKKFTDRKVDGKWIWRRDVGLKSIKFWILQAPSIGPKQSENVWQKSNGTKKSGKSFQKLWSTLRGVPLFLEGKDWRNFPLGSFSGSFPIFMFCFEHPNQGCANGTHTLYRPLFCFKRSVPFDTQHFLSFWRLFLVEWKACVSQKYPARLTVLPNKWQNIPSCGLAMCLVVVFGLHQWFWITGLWYS